MLLSFTDGTELFITGEDIDYWVEEPAPARKLEPDEMTKDFEALNVKLHLALHFYMYPEVADDPRIVSILRNNGFTDDDFQKLWGRLPTRPERQAQPE